MALNQIDFHAEPSRKNSIAMKDIVEILATPFASPKSKEQFKWEMLTYVRSRRLSLLQTHGENLPLQWNDDET